VKNRDAILASIVILLSAGFWIVRAAASSGAHSPLVKAEPKDKSSMEDQVVAKEREGLDALKAGHPEEFGKLTADDAVFVDAAGAASKEQVMRNVAGFKLTDYSIDSVNFRQLADKSGLISYKITESGNSHGKDFTARAYISSIWTMRGGKWLCMFSQETSAK
jgi:hypothetical protein